MISTATFTATMIAFMYAGPGPQEGYTTLYQKTVSFSCGVINGQITARDLESGVYFTFKDGVGSGADIYRMTASGVMNRVGFAHTEKETQVPVYPFVGLSGNDIELFYCKEACKTLENNPGLVQQRKSGTKYSYDLYLFKKSGKDDLFFIDKYTGLLIDKVDPDANSYAYLFTK